VREAVVLAPENVPGDKRLVAYIVPDREPAFTIDELHRFLKTKLPAYMMPSAFVLLDSLPLTPNGKVDRQALPAPHQARSELEGAFVAPRTPLELRIAEIWQDMLGADQVGVYDNFFDLGGIRCSPCAYALKSRRSSAQTFPWLPSSRPRLLSNWPASSSSTWRAKRREKT